MQNQKYLPKTLTHPARPPITVNSVDEEAQWTALGFAPVRTAEYAQYPKSLSHPDHVPTKLISPARSLSAEKPTGGSQELRATAALWNHVPEVWEPEKYPPVIVQNAMQEAEAAAKGYRATGTPNPAIYAQSQGPREEIILFPKWVTPPQGEAVLVKSAAEENALRAKWREGTKREVLSRGKAPA